MQSPVRSRRLLIDGAWAAVLLCAVAVVVAVDAAADRPDYRRAANGEPADNSNESPGENLLGGGAEPVEPSPGTTTKSTAAAPVGVQQPTDAGEIDKDRNKDIDDAKPQADVVAELATATTEPQDAPPAELAVTTTSSDSTTTEPPTVATTEPPPMPPEQPATTVEWKLAEKDVLYQEVEIDRRSAFQVQGLPISTASKYRVLSKVVVEKTAPDGTRVLRQMVLDTKLDAADDLSKATIGGALKALKGREFVITFGPHMELVKFEGQGDKPQAVPLDELGGLDGLGLGDLGLGGQGMFVSSAIDNDGWKELAELSFFQPDKPPRYLGDWERPMQHDWGPLGSWAGKTSYKYKGEDDDVHRIEYRHAMKYAPPGKDAGAMPFAVADARFQPQQAGGEVFFDARAGRVHSAAEVFHVKGQLAVTLLGQNTNIGLEERQAFKVRIHAENPWED